MLAKKLILPVISLALITTGCATTNAEKGATIGAVAGAVLGKSTGNHKDKRLVLGAAIGALAGAVIGDYMDKQEAEFRQELSGSGIDVVREGNNLRLIMPSNITFATDQSYISTGFHATLDDIAKVLIKYDKTLLSIEGHTDNTGSNEYNQDLSLKRANSVKNYLVHKNILAARLNVKGFGENMPLVANDTPQNRALNRRVEIQIVPNEA